MESTFVQMILRSLIICLDWASELSETFWNNLFWSFVIRANLNNLNSFHSNINERNILFYWMKVGAFVNFIGGQEVTRSVLLHNPQTHEEYIGSHLSHHALALAGKMAQNVLNLNVFNVLLFECEIPWNFNHSFLNIYTILFLILYCDN